VDRDQFGNCVKTVSVIGKRREGKITFNTIAILACSEKRVHKINHVERRWASRASIVVCNQPVTIEFPLLYVVKILPYYCFYYLFIYVPCLNYPSQ
jgi:hypothetical protein